MSIVMCDDCEKRIDLDYDEAEEIKMTTSWLWLCSNCYGEFMQGEVDEK